MIRPARPLQQRARLARRALVNLALAAVAALLLLGTAGRARAQAVDADPPGRVARLSDVTGQVWLYSPDAAEWLSVARNRPITSGDRIATDTNARAEIALGTTTLRLDAGTELEVVRLDDARFVVRLAGGSVVARLRNAPAAAEFELDTDEGRFRAQAAGRFRFDRFDQASDLTVYAGQAVFEGRNSALPLSAGQHGQFWLDAAGAAQYTLVQPVRDAFAAWSDERDRAEDSLAVARYVSPEMTGADDLERYGRWEQTPEYGALWAPAAVPVGWVPYGAGHWAFVRPWGWTWVDDAPWGFAPFHYGRWVNYRDRWCWAPGSYVARPVYAPALVAWVGGPRVSVRINIGGGGPPVGWFPLAPREVYVPSYRTSTTYVRNVNITHVTNVTNITTIVNNRNGEADRRDFANRRFPNAVTVVPANVLTGRQAVGPSAVQYRNDPQVRAFVSDTRPGPALTAPPVAAPPAPPRGQEARPTPKPPFEGRGPGGFAGRGGEGPRPDAGRDVGRPGGRPEADRPAGAAAAIAPQRPLGGEAAAPIAPVAPMVQGREPAAPGSLNGRPPKGDDAQNVGRPPRGGIGRDGRDGREPGAADGGAQPPQRVVPPSPVQRGQADFNGRPGLAPREGRGPNDGPVGGRGGADAPRAAGAMAPIGGVPRAEPPPRIAEPAITRVQPEPPRAIEPARPPVPVRGAEPRAPNNNNNAPPAFQPRQERINEGPRGGGEAPRAAPPQRAPEARPAAAEAPPRAESPKARDEPRRDDKR